MPQFFIKSENIVDNKYVIDGEDYYHLSRVRRIKSGDILYLRDDTGALINAKVLRVTDSYIETEIVERKGSADIPLCNLNLCVSLLKGKNFDLVLQKGVEIGVSKIIPFVSERTIPHPDDKGSRIERWNRITVEAAKQSMRDRPPVVEEIHSFKELIYTDLPGMKIIAHPAAGTNIKKYLAESGRSMDIHLIIGPEGGFSENELLEAERAGWVSLHYGFTQLRAETAALVLSSIIIYEWS